MKQPTAEREHALKLARMLDKISTAMIDVATSFLPECKAQGFSMQDAANLALTALLETYATMAAGRKEPEDFIREATVYLNDKSTRTRMAHFRAARANILEF